MLCSSIFGHVPLYSVVYHLILSRSIMFRHVPWYIVLAALCSQLQALSAFAMPLHVPPCSVMFHHVPWCIVPPCSVVHRSPMFRRVPCCIVQSALSLSAAGPERVRDAAPRLGQRRVVQHVRPRRRRRRRHDAPGCRGRRGRGGRNGPRRRGVPLALRLSRFPQLLPQAAEVRRWRARLSGRRHGDEPRPRPRPPARVGVARPQLPRRVPAALEVGRGRDGRRAAAPAVGERVFGRGLQIAAARRGSRRRPRGAGRRHPDGRADGGGGGRRRGTHRRRAQPAQPAGARREVPTPRVLGPEAEGAHGGAHRAQQLPQQVGEWRRLAGVAVISFHSNYFFKLFFQIIFQIVFSNYFFKLFFQIIYSNYFFKLFIQVDLRYL